MKVVFFGSPSIALPSFFSLINAGHEITLVITQPDRKSGRGKKETPSAIKEIALKKGIPVYQPGKIRKDSLAIEKIREADPDVNIVVAYGQIIPGGIIYFPEFHSLNVHFSLLPKYRGAAPVQWAILKGENKTGVTIFELNEKMDEGDILSQQETEIFPEESILELESRLAHLGAHLLVQTLNQIKTINPAKQDSRKATYAPLLRKEDGNINWDEEASYIERQVRAFNPWPSAFTFFNGIRIKILKAKKIREKTGGSFKTGEILDIRKTGIIVECGKQSALLVEKLQPESKKILDAYNFSLGAKITPGDRFTCEKTNEERD